MILRLQDLVRNSHQTQEYTYIKKLSASFLLKQRLMLFKPRFCEQVFSQITLKTQIHD